MEAFGPMAGVGGGIVFVPYDIGGMLPRGAAMGHPVLITVLPSALQPNIEDDVG